MQLFDFVLAEFEIANDSQSKSQQLMNLNQWLLERYRAGETAICLPILLVCVAFSLTN
jgi:hypothetical protein